MHIRSFLLKLEYKYKNILLAGETEPLWQPESQFDCSACFLYGAKYIKLTSSNKCVHRKQTRSTNLISMDVSVCMLKTLHLNVGTMCVCARHNCIWFFKRLFLFFILWTIYCLFLMLSCFFEISEKHVRERESVKKEIKKKNCGRTN